jgi:hypothetical protein
MADLFKIAILGHPAIFIRGILTAYSYLRLSAGLICDAL